MCYVRCANCGARRSLPRRSVDDYIRIPRCKNCGKRKWWRDNYRAKRRREERKRTCNPYRGGCNGYSFPHRRGSGYCIHNPNLTDARLIEREQLGFYR